MKVAVIAGHTAINPGNDFRDEEHRICRAVAEEVEELLDQAGVDLLVPQSLDALYAMDNDDGLNAKVHLVNQAQVDLAVELHLNGGAGDYSSVLHHPRSALGSQAASYIGRMYQYSFKWAAHGGVPETRYGRGGLAFLHQTAMPAVICEPGFLDNDNHQWQSPVAQQIYAMASATGILHWIEEQ
tara:strand:+ start:11305 stop:11856 length:552 start_codon:yes stop_codon:yes gene_type:complete